MANNNFKVRNGIDIGPVTGATNTTIDGATGDVSTIGQFTSTQANDATTGQAQIYLNGATGNRIDFNTNGQGIPTTTTRSAGTKIVLFPSVNATFVDYAIGAAANEIWSSVKEYSAGQTFKWYGGTTEIANLNGVGDLQIDGDLTVTGNDIKSSTATAITLSGADVTILGDLTVSGTTTTIDTANLLVEDKNITIGNVASPTDTTAAGGGITLLGATNKTITWNNATDGWEFNQAITATGGVGAPSFTVDNRASIDSSTLTTTSTATVTLINTGRTAMSVMITAVQGANVHCVNATVLKTGASTAMLTIYGEMYNTSSLVSFTADVSGGITRLLITPTSATSTVFNAVRTSLD